MASGGAAPGLILSPLVPSFLSFCSAMPCSEATPTISPSKRARPAEDAMRLRFVRLSEHATAPSKGSARAAGYDLYSAYDYTVPPMEKVLVKTDIQIALPSGCYGRVAPRSGLAAKHFIDVGAGVIDEDYRGNVGVVLFNFGKEKFEVKKGDRIAQLICERIFYPEIEEVQEKTEALPEKQKLFICNYELTTPSGSKLAENKMQQYLSESRQKSLNENNDYNFK
uniref:Deoxyuridine 5'-triphosphate nucleotidohydrolase n=1 Tax=Felis catus TaxID=9685 RepID=A0ABI7XSH3_FELCA